MSSNVLYAEIVAHMLLPAFRPFENFVLFHTIDEVPGYDRR